MIVVQSALVCNDASLTDMVFGGFPALHVLTDRLHAADGLDVLTSSVKAGSNVACFA